MLIKNGWNNHVPGWNFCKYIINEEGILTNYFSQLIAPLSKEIQDIITPGIFHDN